MIFQVTLEKDGVTIRGNSLKLVDYPADVAAIESLAGYDKNDTPGKKKSTGSTSSFELVFKSVQAS